jgi:hypothetical protein
VAKLVAVILAATGAGWALAASTGVVPMPFQESPPSAPGPGESQPGGGPATSVDSGQPWASPSDGASPSAEQSGEPMESAEATPSGEPGTPSAQLNVRGLCNAYMAQGEDPQKLTHANGFGKLVTAAGSIENVSPFCRYVLGLEPPSPGPSPSPGDSLGPSPTPTPSPSV